jgi:hypothetical protein
MSLLSNDGLRRLLVDGIRLVRARLFRHSRDAEPALVAEATEEGLIDVLAEAGYVHPWLLSYHYEGEDVNLVQFWYAPERFPELPYRQDHVRLFVDEYPDGEVGLEPHTEASAVTHREAHLEEVTFAEGPAIERVTSLLEHAGIDYRRTA